MAAGADRERQVVLQREPQRGGHVGVRPRTGDQRRPAVDRAVPDAALGLVVGVVRGDDLAAERGDRDVGEDAHGGDCAA